MGTEQQIFSVLSISAFVFSLICLYFYYKRRKLHPIKHRSHIVSVVFYFCIFVALLFSTIIMMVGGESNCGLYYFLTFVSLNMFMSIYCSKAGILYYIHRQTKKKLTKAKLLLVDQSKKSGDSESTNTLEKLSSKANLNSDDGLEFDGDINSDNVGDVIQQFEKDFYKTKFFETKRFEIIMVLVKVVVYSIIAIITIFSYDLHKVNSLECKLPMNKGPMIIFQVFYFIHLIVLSIKCLEIRKIQDINMIKNEVYSAYIILLISFVVTMISEKADIKIKCCWLYLVLSFMLFIISFVLPIVNCYKIENKLINNQKKNGGNNFYNFFKSIINHKKKVSYWIEFAQSNYSVENIMFYRSVNEFKNKKCKRAKKALSKNIINNYIKTTSPLIINISSNVRDSVLKNFETNPLDKELYDGAIEEILHLMYSNSFPAFYNSFYHHQMIIENTLENPSNYLVNSENSNSDTELKNISKSIKIKSIKKNKTKKENTSSD
ncbi:double hit isoform b [Anaeramoeba flamelloides]|uniref:Double hit isoform b n=1 Tax=Anaeramoeba flamelloides TaxID=1746091 RepID=A0AAV7Z9Q0_9EUKA|nr:double hit isoform b [Anaeramoeba flamelloides]